MANLIFYTLQTGLFAALFDDEDDEESQKFFEKRYQMTANSIVDGLLRGLGFGGAAVSTLKNMLIKYIQQEKKGNFDESVVVMEFLNLSPPIGSKARKIVSAMKTLKYQKEEIKDMSRLNINNPM